MPLSGGRLQQEQQPLLLQQLQQLQQPQQQSRELDAVRHPLVQLPRLLLSWVHEVFHYAYCIYIINSLFS